MSVIKVAIVEDDYRIANIHEAFMKKVKGITVAGKVLNGEAALKLVAKKHIDLILLDMYMPDMLGTEVIQAVSAINPSIDFIVISAAVEKGIVQKAIRGGVFDYIIKPVKMEQFIDTMERYVKIRGRLEEKEDVDQAFLDDYFGHRTKGTAEKETPKGIDPLTLEKVIGIIRQVEAGLTAEEMGNQIGASRTTARRYLEYLISIGDVAAELEYGIVGRPERKYRIKD